MAGALKEGLLVVLFAEGTSSGGASVLPFKSSLLASAIQTSSDLTAAYIQYALSEGEGIVSEEVCYWGDMTLLPHLFNLLRKRTVLARVDVAALPTPTAGYATDRTTLARCLHAQVLQLRDAFGFPSGREQV